MTHEPSPSQASLPHALQWLRVCCARELCTIGELAFPGAVAPCPALKLRGDGRSTYCQLVAVEIAAGMKPVIQASLGIGLGCSMPDDL